MTNEQSKFAAIMNFLYVTFDLQEDLLLEVERLIKKRRGFDLIHKEKQKMNYTKDMLKKFTDFIKAGVPNETIEQMDISKDMISQTFFCLLEAAFSHKEEQFLEHLKSFNYEM